MSNRMYLPKNPDDRPVVSGDFFQVQILGDTSPDSMQEYAVHEAFMLFNDWAGWKIIAIHPACRLGMDKRCKKGLLFIVEDPKEEGAKNENGCKFC